MIAAAKWEDVPPTSWPWKYFTPREMACRGDGSIQVDENFMDRLELLRSNLGFPLKVSSGYRSPAYNATVSDTGEGGPHTTGHAVDILATGLAAFSIVREALKLGFTGVGVSQRGDRSQRFVHLDDIANDNAIPRPTIWSY